MSHPSFKKLARRIGGARTQYGGLCWRERNGKLQVLLVTSRRTGRWVIPKGWPEAGERPPAAALREAHEEAGVEGKVAPVCIGVFSYVKHADLDAALPCMVAVYPVKVGRLLGTWPERSERRRKWFSLKKAAAEIGEKELSRLIKGFDPAALRR
ncbi:MAG: NUDIX hydrolase [Paracoccaceae bacterium]|nr:NUDIX hydrolase [Paracoccaceae bacterium]